MESPLTKRQQEILIAMKNGYYTDQQIADHLHLSVHTIRKQLRRASCRTNIYGRLPLLDAAVRNGWLEERVAGFEPAK